MPLTKLNTDKLPFHLSPTFVLYLQGQAEQYQDKGAITLNFRDPQYSPDKGEYHPVEIRLEREGLDGDSNIIWRLCYVTDFSYVGSGYTAELARDLDWTFDAGICQTRYEVLPIEQTKELFELWESNFMAYVLMGVFEVTISTD